MDNDMTEENDSFDDAVVSREDAIRAGLRFGASYAFLCLDHTGMSEAVFCMPGECSGTMEKTLWRACYHVDTIDLDEIRKNESIK